MERRLAISIGILSLAAASMVQPTLQGRAQAQDSRLIVVIEDYGPGPTLPLIDVTVDGQRQRAELGPEGRAEASFARGVKGRVIVGVTYRRAGSAQAVAAAREELSLNGSGVVRIRRVQNGEIIIDQYAEITLDARPSKLQLELNGGGLGETLWHDGIIPEKEHVFVWLGANDKPICRMKKTFPPNITRRYTCVIRPQQPPIIEVS